MITSVQPAGKTVWPAGWEDVEVVDSVLVEDAPVAGAVAAADAGAYDRSGRLPAFQRFGRIVSVLA